MDTGPVPIKWQHWAGLFSELFCYRKTPVKTQSLTEFQNSVLIIKHFWTLEKYLLQVISNIYYFHFDYVLVNQSERYHLLEIARYLNSPSVRNFFPHYTSVFQFEVESVYFYHALYVYCFAFTFFKRLEILNFIMKA